MDNIKMIKNSSEASGKKVRKKYTLTQKCKRELIKQAKW